MADWFDVIHGYFRFSENEITSVLVAGIILGFIFSFADFSFFNLLIAVIIALVSLLFHVSAQKVFSLKIGYDVDFHLSWYGLLFGLIVVFLSNGSFWWVLFPGGLTFSLIARHRLGRFRYGLNYWPMGWVAFSGPLASIVFGTFFKNINLYLLGSPVPVLDQIFVFNLVLAVCTMLPFPPLDGHYMFYASRSWYLILFSAVTIYTVLVAFDVFSWIWAVLGALIIWLFYFVKFESGYW